MGRSKFKLMYKTTLKPEHEAINEKADRLRLRLMHEATEES